MGKVWAAIGIIILFLIVAIPVCGLLWSVWFNGAHYPGGY
jgi:hypothetical protein